MFLHVGISDLLVPLQVSYTCGTCSPVPTVSPSALGLVQKAFIQSIDPHLGNKKARNVA